MNIERQPPAADVPAHALLVPPLAKVREVEHLAHIAQLDAIQYGRRSFQALESLGRLQAAFDGIRKSGVQFWFDETDTFGDLCVTSPYDFEDFPISHVPLQVAGHVEQLLPDGRVRILKSRMDDHGTILDRSRCPAKAGG